MTKSRNLTPFIVFLIIVLLMVIFILKYSNKFLHIFKVVFYSLTFSYILLPIVQFFERYMKPYMAIILLIILVILIFILLIFLFLPMFTREITTLISRLPYYADQTRRYYETILGHMEYMGLPHGLRDIISIRLDTLQNRVGDTLILYAQKAVSLLSRSADIAIAMVLGFYILKDRKYFSDVFISIIPSSIRRATLDTLRKIDKVLQSFIRVQLVISLIIALLSMVGFMLVGLPYAITLGLLCGVFEIIPYFGPFIGAVPALIIAILNAPNKIIWTAITIILVQQIEGNIITPQIMGYSMELHPALVILVLWMGGVLFGIWGMFFAVPVFLIIRIIVKSVYIGIVSNRQF